MFFVFTTTVFLPKSIFHSRVYGETTPVHCCEMSRHISHAWQGSSPPLGTRGAELPLVSATVVEAVDRSRDRQTYVPSKIQEGRACLFSKRPLSLQCITTPCCCLRRGCFMVSFGSQLKLWQSYNWNHLSVAHRTHTMICVRHTELKGSKLQNCVRGHYLVSQQKVWKCVLDLRFFCCCFFQNKMIYIKVTYIKVAVSQTNLYLQ